MSLVAKLFFNEPKTVELSPGEYLRYEVGERLVPEAAAEKLLKNVSIDLIEVPEQISGYDRETGKPIYVEQEKLDRLDEKLRAIVDAR